MKKFKLTKKEKREIGLVLGAVVVVTLLGVLLQLYPLSNVGLATEYATVGGSLSIINKYTPIGGDGKCKDLCGEMTCIPWRENCETVASGNQCYCIDVPK